MLSKHLYPLELRPAARRVRGFGMLQVLLLVSVMAGLASVGYLQWRERAVVDTARQERQALAQADQALIAYATVFNRFPCADTNRDGLEDCGDPDDQKGWLPSVTLRLAGADSGVDVGQLRYLVQRGAGGNDLTPQPLTDTWKPLEYDDGGEGFAGMRDAGYPTNILTLTDLCQRLTTAPPTAPGAVIARVNTATPRNVAYALAHPGNDDADGDGDLFDGANSSTAANANLMEDPVRRPLLATYNDIVLERSPASLLAAFQCQPLIDSINTVALGHDVADQVDGMRTDNIDSATRAVAFSALAALMTSLEIALAIAEAGSDGVNAAVDWVGCAASLGLAVNLCAAAPQHTAAGILAGGVIAANTVAVGLNIAAALTAGTALVLADSSATPAQVCPPRDQSLVDRMLASSRAELTAATAARVAVQTDITNKTNELNTAIAARTAAVAALRAVLLGGAVSSQIDALVDPLLLATENWGVRDLGRESADSKVTQATRERDLWAAEVAKYNAMLADSAGAITRLTNEIAALDALIATNPSNKSDLQDQRAGKAAELKLAGDRAGLTAVRDKAVASQATAQAALDTAIADRNTANTNFATARTNYQSAYANLVNGAGRFAIYASNGSVIRYLCTTGCLVGDTNISTAFFAALDDLMGSGASANPSPNAKYLKPVKLQKELDSLNDRLNAARRRETDAQTQVDQAEATAANPAACNVTGSAAIPMTPDQASAILESVDRKGGMR